jgi:hypothetical protein
MRVVEPQKPEDLLPPHPRHEQGVPLVEPQTPDPEELPPEQRREEQDA